MQKLYSQLGQDEGQTISPEYGVVLTVITLTALTSFMLLAAREHRRAHARRRLFHVGPIH